MRFGSLNSYLDKQAKLLEQGRSLILPVMDDPKGITSRISSEIKLTKGRYLLVPGPSGTGKTAWVDTMLIKLYLSWKLNGGPKPYVIYRSMERPGIYKEAKWKAMLLYYDTGQVVTVDQILGIDPKVQLDPTTLSKLRSYTEVLDEMRTDCLDFKEGVVSPNEALRYAESVVKQAGIVIESNDKQVFGDGHLYHTFTDFEEVGDVRRYFWDCRWGRIYQNEKLFFPDDDTHYFHVSDTIQKYGEDKGVLDNHASNMGDVWRDLYGGIVIDISQLNRDIFDTYRQMKTTLTMKESDIKGSNVMVQNADYIVGILDPTSFGYKSFEGFDLEKLSDSFGNTRFRALICVKNSWGKKGWIQGLMFIGENGWTWELPSELSYNDYETIIKLRWRP